MLWKLIIDKDMNKKASKKVSGISSASVVKLGKGEYIKIDIRIRICNALEFDIPDVMQVVKDFSPEVSVRTIFRCDRCDNKRKRGS